jgi:hypothetical protein
MYEEKAEINVGLSPPLSGGASYCIPRHPRTI